MTHFVTFDGTGKSAGVRIRALGVTLRGAGRPLLEASFHTDGPGATLLPELHAALSGRSSLKAFWEEERLFSGAPQVTLSATLSGLVVGRVQTSRSEGASLTTYSALMPLTRADLAWFTFSADGRATGRSTARIGGARSSGPPWSPHRGTSVPRCGRAWFTGFVQHQRGISQLIIG